MSSAAPLQRYYVCPAIKMGFVDWGQASAVLQRSQRQHGGDIVDIRNVAE